MEETVIKDECGYDKFNISKFRTNDGCFLAVASVEIWSTVNVSFDDTVETLYKKLTDDDENSSCFPSGCTVPAEESEEKIYKLSKVESGEQTHFRVYFKENVCGCLFSTSVKDLWKMITDISK